MSLVDVELYVLLPREPLTACRGYRVAVSIEAHTNIAVVGAVVIVAVSPRVGVGHGVGIRREQLKVHAHDVVRILPARRKKIFVGVEGDLIRCSGDRGEPFVENVLGPRVTVLASSVDDLLSGDARALLREKAVEFCSSYIEAVGTRWVHDRLVPQCAM